MSLEKPVSRAKKNLDHPCGGIEPKSQIYQFLGVFCGSIEPAFSACTRLIAPRAFPFHSPTFLISRMLGDMNGIGRHPP
ncbi:hypothetical protein [Rhizobium sp. NFR03]|uniref:hypothetical protein n=1 Tax=Rhizobium sp. NFR03 TaxID=1566263 RepID=UPI0011148ADA|nr:hypothetical protein [Rhizobium sp. NFR03]